MLLIGFAFISVAGVYGVHCFAKSGRVSWGEGLFRKPLHGIFGQNCKSLCDYDEKSYDLDKNIKIQRLCIMLEEQSRRIAVTLQVAQEFAPPKPCATSKFHPHKA